MKREQLIKLIETLIPEGANVVAQGMLYMQESKTVTPMEKTILNIGMPLYPGGPHRLICETKTYYESKLEKL